MQALDCTLPGGPLGAKAPKNETGLPRPSEDAARHSRRVADTLRTEIAVAGGWISFARFMELALYAPGLGYYVAGAAKFGAEGDFVTAPDISPLFGRTLATQVAQALAGGGEILELGAGDGALAVQLLEQLQALNCPPSRYAILEPGPELRRRQRQALSRLPDDLSSRVEWIDTLPEKFSGVLLANEVLDALPVHRVAWRAGAPVEVGVGWQEGKFREAERELRPGALRDLALSIAPEGDYLSEISLAAPALIRALAERLDAGVLLFIDYGFGRREFYHPQRSRGTMMCHYRHRTHDEVFFLPGLQDLSAHVEFSSLAEAGIEGGLELLGYTSQAQFLINCGITDLLSHTSAGDPASYLPRAAGVQKLLSPAEMGELFKVLALGKGLTEPLAGFRAGDRSHTL